MADAWLALDVVQDPMCSWSPFPVPAGPGCPGWGFLLDWIPGTWLNTYRTVWVLHQKKKKKKKEKPSLDLRNSCHQNPQSSDNPASGQPPFPEAHHVPGWAGVCLLACGAGTVFIYLLYRCKSRGKKQLQRSPVCLFVCFGNFLIFNFKLTEKLQE